MSVDLTNISQEVIGKVRASIVAVYQVVPVKWDESNSTLTVAVGPATTDIDDLKFVLNCNVELVLAVKADLEAAIAKYYGFGLKMETHTEHIADWIAGYVEDVGAKGVVIGLSGGVDSSVVAALSVNALGANRVAGLFMPCDSSYQDATDARHLAKWLGVGFNTVYLRSTYNSVMVNLFVGQSQIAQANVKSRLRMISLYAYAGQLDYLVVGTTNKSEMAIGYFTKWGDGGVDIEPIASYYKTDIYKMAEVLGIAEAFPSIVTKPPSAGLWDGQTDEGEIGVTYKVLDKYLKCCEDSVCSVSLAEEIGRDMLSKIQGLISRTAHKRKMPPVCDRLTD